MSIIEKASNIAQNKTMIQPEQHVNSFRIVTVGNESVGKTSIVVRLIENRFNAHEPGTIGANYQVYEQVIEGSKIELQIWDTAGQEKFRALAPVYYRSTSAAIVVFSLTNLQSFHSLPAEIETFFNVAGESAIVFIAANKSDLDDEFELSFEECQQWANKHGYKIYLTSAKTGEGIQQMFSDLAHELFKAHQHQIVGKERGKKIEETQPKGSSGCC